MRFQIRKIKHISLFCAFIFISLMSLYLSSPLALYNKQKKNISSIPEQMNTTPLPSQLLNADQIRKTKDKTVYYLNQAHFGISDYEKAQQELQQFNRPLIGIVGQDNDWVSYQEYQKKILATTY